MIKTQNEHICTIEVNVPETIDVTLPRVNLAWQLGIQDLINNPVVRDLNYKVAKWRKDGELRSLFEERVYKFDDLD